jgi:type IV pilus assembly protein PilM
MFFSKNKSIVGVDIGTAYIKVAQVSHGSTKTLDTYGIVNAAVSLESSSGATAIVKGAEILKRLLSEAGVSTKHCVVSLPNSAVFTSIIDMPALSEAELASAISFEAKKYVPLPLSEVILSWSVVAKTSENTNKVLLIAVPKQIQQHYIQLFAQSGLELSIIEIEALALLRSLTTETKDNSVIIDIGARTTGLNVVVGGVLQLTRNLNIGGDTITETIAQTLNISIPRADQFKKDFGISDASFIPEAVKPVIMSIKNEVKQLLSIYSAKSQPINNIILVGGGSQLPGLIDFFQDLGVPATFGNPLGQVHINGDVEPLVKRFALQMPVAIGLALRQPN